MPSVRLYSIIIRYNPLCLFFVIFIYDAQVPIHPHLAVQFRVAYDCYVELERRIDERIRVAMKQSTRQDYLRALCCLCSYMLLAEIVLFPAKLFSMDGNSSLKNMDSSYRAGSDRLDNREVSSHRWISEPQVDVFKDEVKRRDKKVSALFISAFACSRK